MAETDSGETPIEQRVDRLEEGQQSISHRLDEVLAKLTGGGPAVSHDVAQQQTEDRLDRPTDMATAVRAELARAKQEEADEADQRSVKEQLADLRSKMTEKTPEPPQPRRERVMWGSR